MLNTGFLHCEPSGILLIEDVSVGSTQDQSTLVCKKTYVRVCSMTANTTFSFVKYRLSTVWNKCNIILLIEDVQAGSSQYQSEIDSFARQLMPEFSQWLLATAFDMLNTGCLQYEPSGILLIEDVHCSLDQVKTKVHWFARQLMSEFAPWLLTRPIHVLNTGCLQFEPSSMLFYL